LWCFRDQASPTILPTRHGKWAFRLWITGEGEYSIWLCENGRDSPSLRQIPVVPKNGSDQNREH
jgi:hypothetical protein